MNFLKAHRWKLIILGVGAVLLSGAIYLVAQPSKPEYITELSQRGDLVQTVEAVGTVISDRDLQLQFRNFGIVSQVLVKEGDTVKAGQKLAAIRAGDLSASVSSAAARVRELEASLRALREGTRPEEIAIAEAQVENKKAALEIARSTLRTAESNMLASASKLDALKAEASVNLAGQIDQAPLIASQNITVVEQALPSISDILTKENVRAMSTAYNKNPTLIIDHEKSVMTAIGNLKSISFVGKDYKEVLSLLEQYKKVSNDAFSALTDAYELINSLSENSNLSFYNSDKEAYRNTLAEKRSAVQNVISNIDAFIQSFRNAVATYDTRISAEESAYSSSKGAKEKAEADIRNYETSIQIDEAQLALKRAGTRQSDIDAAVARLGAARADWSRAASNFSDTVIIAPANGRITNVNIKVGEISPNGPAITLLGESPYRIEIFVSEIDIPKMKIDDPGSIELDAFPGVDYKVHVSEIDEAQTLVDGVAKYRVKIDFVYPHDEFKLGMTGDTRIITGERTDVVYVPSRAVLEDDERKYVRVLEGEMMVEKDVETGLEGEGGDLEIIKGLDANESIIILVK